MSKDGQTEGFMRARWFHLGGALEGMNVPGGAILVVSFDDAKQAKGIAAAMCFVPFMQIVQLGDEVGFVSTMAGSTEAVMDGLQKAIRKNRRSLGEL